MTRNDKLKYDGYEFLSFEYDYDAQRNKLRLENCGYKVKLKRERTDTKGLKMFSIWFKHGNKNNFDEECKGWYIEKMT